MDRKITAIATSMMNINSEKLYASQLLKAYIGNRHPPSTGVGSWQEVHRYLDPIAGDIAALLELMQAGDAYLVRVADLASNSLLFASLHTQADTYKQVAGLPEPQSADDKKNAGELAKELDGILAKIQGLETQIGKFVQHTGAPPGKPCT